MQNLPIFKCQQPIKHFITMEATNIMSENEFWCSGYQSVTSEFTHSERWIKSVARKFVLNVFSANNNDFDGLTQSVLLLPCSIWCLLLQLNKHKIMEIPLYPLENRCIWILFRNLWLKVVNRIIIFMYLVFGFRALWV